MHTHSLDHWTHEHVFLGRDHARNERRTWLVVGLTTAMMVAEIAAGTVFGSMALLADGWHMATHATALAISAGAYLYARRHARDPRFTFGTGKLGDLAGFASAAILAVVAILVAYESLLRLASPEPIAYAEATTVAVIGLVVNVACAWLLREDHHHDHERHGHSHDDQDRHGHEHQHGHPSDNNLRAAYLHVLADAVTSILAIAGLLLARAYQWPWIDAAVGLVGASLIARWSYGLLRDSARVLLDVVPQTRVEGEIRRRLENGGDRIADLHIWQVGPGHQAAIVSLVTSNPKAPSVYKNRLSHLPGLSHVTVEVEQCPDEHRLN